MVAAVCELNSNRQRKVVMKVSDGEGDEEMDNDPPVSPLCERDMHTNVTRGVYVPAYTCFISIFMFLLGCQSAEFNLCSNLVFAHRVVK